VIIAIDFDGTLVQHTSPHDPDAHLLFTAGAREGLASLRAAGHVLLLYSARANRSLREDPQLDPLVRAGVKRVDMRRWAGDQAFAEQRYQQMVAFVEKELPGVFAAIDDGQQGKPLVDMLIDDLAMRYGHGATALGWRALASLWGEPVYNQVEEHHGREASGSGT